MSSFLFLSSCFETGSFYYVDRTVQELAMCIWLTLNSQRSVCLCFLRAGIKYVHHYDQGQIAIKAQVTYTYGILPNVFVTGHSDPCLLLSYIGKP